MKSLWVGPLAIVTLAGCSSPAPTAPASNMPPATPALIAIAKAAPEPALTASELRRLGTAAAGDLDAIIARGHLRVLVVSSRTQYSIENGQQQGATFDAGQALEAFINARLLAGTTPVRVVFIPVRQDALVADLNAGHGDIASNLSITFERDDLVTFSEPIRKGVRELVVTGPGVPPLVTLEDVAGRAIHVRQSSDHYSSLIRLNGQLAKVDKPVCKIVAAAESFTDEDLLAQVNTGAIAATLVDDYVYEAMKPRLDRITTNDDVAVSQDGQVAWAVRKNSPKLIALLNDFVTAHDLARAGRAPTPSR